MITSTATLTAETSILIQAVPAHVWKAITTPADIKEYLMGTDVQTDWKEGSPISYSGIHNGMSYHDKGTILKIEPEQLFQSTYWSSMGGKEDKPENYNTVTYRLVAIGSDTMLTLLQDNIHSNEEREHAIRNWSSVLKKLKEIVENRY